MRIAKLRERAKRRHWFPPSEFYGVIPEPTCVCLPAKIEMQKRY